LLDEEAEMTASVWPFEAVCEEEEVMFNSFVLEELVLTELLEEEVEEES
jgi:hypothetical protein